MDALSVMQRSVVGVRGLVVLNSGAGNVPTLPTGQRVRSNSPSYDGGSVLMCASTIGAAFTATVSSTGCMSVGELAITPKISLVAVCCSNASVRSRLRSSNSLNNRTFSMAMTAWSAKILRSAICFSEKGRTSVRRTKITPIATLSRSKGVAKAETEYQSQVGCFCLQEIRFALLRPRHEHGWFVCQ